MLDATWGLHSVVLVAGSSVTFSQTSRRTINKNVRTVTNYAPGAVHPTYAAVMTAEPMASFETTEIGRVLTAVPLTGAGIGADLTDLYTSAQAYYVKKQNKGSRASGSVHARYSGSFGLAVLRRLRCKWGQEATIEVEIFVGSTDGDNQPLSMATGVALDPLVVDQKWTLGYAALNGVEIDHHDLDIDFGAVVEAKGSGPDIYNTNINLKRRSPVARIKNVDPSLFATYDLDGVPIGASHCEFYLRKMLKNAARTADATAEHIRLRFLNGQGIIVPGDDSGSESDDVECDFSVVGTSDDGVNESVSITNGIVHP